MKYSILYNLGLFFPTKIPHKIPSYSIYNVQKAHANICRKQHSGKVCDRKVECRCDLRSAHTLRQCRFDPPLFQNSMVNQLCGAHNHSTVCIMDHRHVASNHWKFPLHLCDAFTVRTSIMRFAEWIAYFILETQGVWMLLQ